MEMKARLKAAGVPQSELFGASNKAALLRLAQERSVDLSAPTAVNDAGSSSSGGLAESNAIRMDPAYLPRPQPSLPPQPPTTRSESSSEAQATSTLQLTAVERTASLGLPLES